MRPAASAAAPLLLALALVPAGCGDEERVLDAAVIEDQVATRLAATVGERPRVACPRTLPTARGGTFTCTVTARDGQRSDARVRLVDDDGRYRVTLAPR